MNFNTAEPTLTIVIPAYNEEQALRSGKLQRVLSWIALQSTLVELIVVDDGSRDATARLAEENSARVIRIPHAGKAAAIMTGIQAARGEIILFTDMDQATPITEADRLLDILQQGPAAGTPPMGGTGNPTTSLDQQGVDIAIGSRGLVRRGAPVGRYLLSWGQVALRWIILGLAISDTQCGFKAMRRQPALDILNHLRVYTPVGFTAGSPAASPRRPAKLSGPSVTSGFDVEFLYVAKLLKYRVQEVPVRWNYQDTRRVLLVKDAWRGVKDLLRIAFTNLRGKYLQ
jgi:glycosyltransferase involved in cell wall biosynthesis